ncbi:RnfH family protein [Vandammella animalimorsus]|nr:RnfH family protein [Vandammella animalimorsus]
MSAPRPPVAASDSSAPPMLQVEVALCLAPRCIEERLLQLPQGTTLAQAVALLLQQRPCSLDEETWQALQGQWRWGIWGRRTQPDEVLRDGDRIEAYRELLVDPKQARRERFARQGARGVGLFAQRRKGSKPGY